MLKTFSIRNPLLACLADCPTDNRARNVFIRNVVNRAADKQNTLKIKLTGINN